MNYESKTTGVLCGWGKCFVMKLVYKKAAKRLLLEENVQKQVEKCHMFITQARQPSQPLQQHLTKSNNSSPITTVFFRFETFNSFTFQEIPSFVFVIVSVFNYELVR